MVAKHGTAEDGLEEIAELWRQHEPKECLLRPKPGRSVCGWTSGRWTLTEWSQEA